MILMEWWLANQGGNCKVTSIYLEPCLAVKIRQSIFDVMVFIPSISNFVHFWKFLKLFDTTNMKRCLLISFHEVSSQFNTLLYCGSVIIKLVSWIDHSKALLFRWVMWPTSILCYFTQFNRGCMLSVLQLHSMCCWTYYEFVFSGNLFQVQSLTFAVFLPSQIISI